MAIVMRHEEIAGLLSMEEAIGALKIGLREQAEGHVQVPSRLTVDSSAGWLRTMPVIMNGSGYMGLKVMHSTKGHGMGYLIALYNLRTGDLLALMDADWITQFRTAATTALGTDYLAPQEIGEVGILGAGEQARAHLVAMRAVRSFERVRVYSPRPERRQAFAEQMSQELGLKVRAVESPEEAVRGAGMVVSAFRAGSEPVIRGEWLEPGVHLNAISSVLRQAREVDDEVWRRCHAIVVDDREHVLQSGDGRSLLQCGAKSPADLVELSEVVGAQRSLPSGPGQITMFKSVGNALQDLVLAIAVYQRAQERGIGTPVGEVPRIRKV